MKRILFYLLFFFLLTSGFTQSGKLDPSFGTNGIVKTDIGSAYRFISNTASQVLVQADGSFFIISNETYLYAPSFISKRLPGGSIDSSYGIDGYSSPVPLIDVYAALQPDGKMLIAGAVQMDGAFYVARMNANGTPDSSFGINGIQSTPSFGPQSHATAVAVQGDGKIILVGSVGNFRVIRFNENGSLDSSFANNGYATIGFPYIEYDRSGPSTYYSGEANAVAIQADGKIIVAGDALDAGANFALVRLNPSGTLDTSFDHDGQQAVLTNPSSGVVGYSLAIQTDGKILLAGRSDGGVIPVVRFNVNGSLDNSFNGSGMQIANLSSAQQIRNALALQTDGKIVLAGYRSDGTYNNFAVVRFNANGSPDNSFSGDGELTTDIHTSDDYGGSVAIQANNKILVAGFSYIYPAPVTQHFDVIRYNTNGNLDSTFGANGLLEGEIKKQGSTSFNDMAIQADGKIVAGGRTWNGTYFEFAIVRYNTDGKPDSSFSGDGNHLTDFGGSTGVASLAVQSNGKIIAAGNAGNSQLVFARYNADGSPDNTFGGDGKVNISPGTAFNCGSLALQADGKIVVTGYASNDIATMRINIDGTPDNTFGQDGIQLTSISNSLSSGSAVAIQSDGKIVVAGRAYINNQNNFALVRYNNDGSLDTSFSGDGKQNNVFGTDHYFGESISIQKDGNIVVGGYGEREYPNRTYIAVARYKSNGSLDSTFGNNGYQATNTGPHFNFGLSTAIDQYGRIAVGGTNDDYTIVLYKNNGTVDSSFGQNGIQTSKVVRQESWIFSLAFSGCKLYAAGRSGIYPYDFGIIARYQVDPAETPLVAGFITSANGNWNEPGTWIGGVVPSPDAEVIVRNNVTITADASCYALKVESPVGKIIVNTGVHLMITH